MLRPLTPIIGLFICATCVLAEEPLPLDFAPGALSDLGVGIEDLLSRAKRDASGLEQSIRPQAPADLSALSPGLEALQARAMNNPRVRELLGLTGDDQAADDAKPNYDAAKVIVFASFAMPAPSLRQVMEDAARYQAQVVMRGFVENSVFKTEAALSAVFGDLADAPGFAIDPTLFQRFKVEAVPVYVVLEEPLSPCETQGCGGDAPPRHDRISGNIELGTALELVARAEGDAQAAAKSLLQFAASAAQERAGAEAAP